MKHTFFFTEINYGVVEIESDTLPNRDDVIRKVIDGYAIWGDSEYSEIGLLDEKSQTVDYLSFNDGKEVIHGYEIQRTILFTDGKGIALAENLNAPDPYVTWQFTEENGKRDYYWGKYTTSKDRATTDFENRATSYHKDNGVSEIGAYKYYSTQRPIDIATYPKTENGPVRFENYDRREEVEQGRMLAWGHLIYDAPLTDDEIYEYELRAAPDNPDIVALMKEQAQLVGHWEEMKGLPDDKRYTWHRPSISAFDLREPIITPALMARRFRRAEHELALENEKTSPKPIMEQLAEAAKNVQHRDSLAISKNTNRDER